jgi:nucleotide-binding universal stress UspA family protein
LLGKTLKEAKMYKKILVPLDGSRFSESSLEHVKAITAGSDVSEVVLLMVLDPVSYFSVGELAAANTKLATQVELQTEQASRAKATEYIDKISETLQKEGKVVSTAIVYGKPAAEILAYAEKNNFDLIIISTHGRSGISRWAFGSVAEVIVRRSSVPVLIVSPLSGLTHK